MPGRIAALLAESGVDLGYRGKFYLYGVIGVFDEWVTHEFVGSQDLESFVTSLLEDNPVVLHRFLRRFGPFDLERAKSDLLMDLCQTEYDNSA